jgi:hypothetical protein
VSSATGDGLPLGAKHGDIGPAKAVDGLPGVADDEQLAAIAVQATHQPALAIVGVLELVHQQRGRFSLPARADRLLGLQQRQRAGLQVVEIQCLSLALQGCITLGRETETGPQARHGLRQRFVLRHKIQL